MVKEVRCRGQVARSLRQLAGRHQRARGECAEGQAAGTISPRVNCMELPVSRGGVGIGVTRVDNRFEGIERKLRRDAARIRENCSVAGFTPRKIGFDTLCPNPDEAANDYHRALDCGYELMLSASDRLEAALAVTPGVATEADSAACRTAVTTALRGAFRGRMAMRAACFRRLSLEDDELNCLATSAWPGKTVSTGLKRVDRELREHLVELHESVERFCGQDLPLEGFLSNPDIDDPTSDLSADSGFSGSDLFHEVVDLLIIESTRVAARMYPGFSYCGDGVVDSALGEECDDGTESLHSCDGCDRDCSLGSCGNGAACGPLESCDDGAIRSGDGCDESCQFEECGDGVVQMELGETCDDGNRLDCDGCDSNCTPSDLCSNGVACAASGEQCDLGLGICVNGLRVHSSCVSDSHCSVCVSGPVAGSFCAANVDCGMDGAGIEYECSTGRCGGVCGGGINDGALCIEDIDCPGRCVPIDGAGDFCLDDAGCFSGLVCNKANACVLPVGENVPCLDNDRCGQGGICHRGSGCLFGNSDIRPGACRVDCLLPSCGDRAVDPLTDTNGLGGEECDDGNSENDDGCDSNCTLTACGNAVVNVGEECDLGPGVCVGGYDDGQACSTASDCRGSCSGASGSACSAEDAAVVCDGFSCVGGGACFGGNVDGVICRQDCQIPRCGDGIIDEGEDCDDGLGVCVEGPDDGAVCNGPGECRGVCRAGPTTGVSCFSSEDCGGAICGGGLCEGGNSDVRPHACPTTCRFVTSGERQ